MAKNILNDEEVKNKEEIEMENNLGILISNDLASKIRDEFLVKNCIIIANNGDEVNSIGKIINGEEEKISGSKETTNLDDIYEKGSIWSDLIKVKDKGRYKANTVNEDDENLQTKIIGNILDFKGKKVFINQMPFKGFNKMMSSTIEDPIITSIFGLQLMSISNQDPNPDISRFDVNNIVRNTIEKKEIFTQRGKIKINNINFESKVMLPDTNEVFEEVSKVNNVLSKELHQLRYDIMKDYHNSIPPEIRSDFKYKSKIALVHLTDYINYQINSISEDEVDRDKLKQAFYRKFPVSFTNGIKINFKGNITRTKTSKNVDPSYEEYRKINEMYQYRSFIKRDDFFIPCNIDIIDKFKQRFIDFQILCYELNMEMICRVLGYEYKTVNINNLLHYNEDSTTFNLLDNDSEFLEKIKDSIRNLINEVEEVLREERFIDAANSFSEKEGE